MSTAIIQNINLIKNQIEIAVKNSQFKVQYPRLVAVSKTKSIDDIITAYKCGLRFFGENYIKELNLKAEDKNLLKECPDIMWHFIGRLQSNKVNQLIRIPHLDVVETVSSLELANMLNTKLNEARREEKLKVMIQVNTSNEQAKSGVSIDDVLSLSQHIQGRCERLKLIGLMTIGSVDNTSEGALNPDFVALSECRDRLCQSLDLPPGDLELSMGMSLDFEHAIGLGSTNVRVGSGIFGARATPL